MKLIHTADLHLDSDLKRNLDPVKARERRGELLVCFQNIVRYALRQGAEAILIAGDLFDKTKISATARDSVISLIVNNPELTFYYLRGNHDEGSFVEDFRAKTGSLPDNFKTFTEGWTSYEQKGADGNGVIISGAEVNESNNGILASALTLNQDRINIVMLHGQETDSSGKKDGEIIPLRDYMNKGIDYLALGHIHAPKIARLDARGFYSYCGCPEGRGYDECGPRGFNLITVENGSVKADFIPFAQRIVYDISVDVKDALTSDDAIAKIKEAALSEGVRDADMLKARLTGEVSMDADFDLTYMKTVLEPDYYFIKIVDETTPFVDYASFAHDASLKGEFVRMVNDEVSAGNLDEKEAAEMIRMGVKLLRGEEGLS